MDPDIDGTLPKIGCLVSEELTDNQTGPVGRGTLRNRKRAEGRP